MGIIRLITKSDSLLIFKERQGICQSSSILGNLVIEIKRIHVELDDCRIQHIYREQNVLAHKLAKHAYQVESIIM